MPLLVVQNAQLMCSMGTAPSNLQLVPRPIASDQLNLAHENDHQPMANVLPFAMCTSMANPQVAAATAAAQGTLTPMPCVPVIPAPWSPVSKYLTMDDGGRSNAALLNSSQCNCQWAGVITIVDPGCTVTIDG